MAKQRKPAHSNASPPSHLLTSPDEGPDLHCPIVGIGASAGGLEAVTDLLKGLPAETGMAFVLVQHLDARQGEMFVELLQRATRMPVRMVTDGMPLQANVLFVNPPVSYMRIEDDRLHLEPHSGPHHMPIDRFFHSLAETRQNRAIAIILSGTGSDGTVGMKAVKTEGGITFAQDDSAKRRDMPQSAIAEHCVDLVLHPAAIAGELVNLSRQPYLRTTDGLAPDLSSDGFSQVFSLLRASTSVDFTFYKQATLQRRIQRRMALRKIDDTRQYAERLKGDAAELQALFQDILIHVTSFFREPSAFEMLRAEVFPVIFNNRSPEDPVRVWVPGCSTGEEVYSLAILILEYLRDTGLECHCQIFGTDLNDAVLDKARAGIYPESISAEVSPERLRRFFIRSNGGYQISRAIRDLCIFARQNVTRDPPFSKLDLISCRNVLIYLGRELQAKVMRTFHYGLKHSGFLLLGISEAIGTAGEFFTPIDKNSRIYHKKQVRPTLEIGPEPYEPAFPSQTAPAESTSHSSALDSRRMVDHLILSRFSPPGIVVTRELRVLQFRGQTSHYLEHSSGEANLNLLRMSRGGVGLEIRRLVQQADKRSATVRSEVLPVPDGDSVRNVRLSVTPVQPSGDTERQFLVIFEEIGARAEERRAPPAGKAAAGRVTAPQRIQQLEQELVVTKQYLQTVIEEQEAASEELKSANEEIQSSNEELQSTNEELLTAKEELQSTNEELTTLNDEMQSRNNELARTNIDLFNLLTSVNIPILMLGMDLCIRRFTPQAERIFSLLPSDIGRPIGDLRLKIDIADLEQLCREVLDSLSTREREVQDIDGRIHSMWVRPYRTAENRIDGVVLSLFDITERRQTAEARYRRMFEAARDGMVIAQVPSGEILDVNPHFCRVTGYGRQQFIGQRFWEHPTFQDTMIDKALLDDLETEDSVHRSATLRTAQGGWAQVDLTANLYSEGGNRVVQFNIRDSGARRDLEDRIRRGDESARHTYRMQAVEHIADSLGQEFNDVLTSIMGHTALLQEGAADTSARENARQIMRAAERAAALTRQLLVFGRRQTTLPEVLDVKEVVQDVSQLLRIVVSKGVDVTFDLAEPLGGIRADRGDLEQILLNLALNAREMMPHGGSIRFAAENIDTDQQFASEHPTIPPGRYVFLTITSRTGEAGRRRQRPVGRREEFTREQIGLSALFSLVSRNGGAMLATSDMASGSSFRVYFPRVDPTQIVRATPRGGSETILVVEDDDSVRHLVLQVLSRLGYAAMAAGSGPEAVRLARERQGAIHLLITDALMPQMNGRELAEEIRARHPAISTLFVSVHPEAQIMEEGILDDTDAFLAKPFPAEALAHKVRELLDSRRAG